MSFQHWDVGFRSKEPGQVKYLKVTIEASSAETAGMDARQALNLRPELFDIIYIHGREPLFDEREILALKVMAASLADLTREDIPGGMMKCGVFRILSDQGLVDLAQKLELTPEEREKHWPKRAAPDKR